MNKMIEINLDKIVGRAVNTVAIGGALSATIGALGAGVYEGYTGLKVFNDGGFSVPFVAAQIGFFTPIIAYLNPNEKSRLIDRKNDEWLIAVGGAAAGIICYGVGQGIGQWLRYG